VGIKIRVDGVLTYTKERGNFIISNHLGYLDGVILGSIFPIVFVSKLQVKSWPVFGWMARVGGTIFIDRQRKLEAPKFIENISKILKNKVNVLLFPEGTSTDGTKILPFQSVFFEAPLRINVSIIPITIQYTKINSERITLQNKDSVFWYGQVKFIKHLHGVAALKNIGVKVTIHPKLESNAQDSKIPPRKQISEESRRIILNSFSFIE
jgi:1-acyl-sn-glycerol-3-phosphate acyltransferase